MPELVPQSSISIKSKPHPKRIFLFDVDGTLTVPRQTVTPEMEKFLGELREKAYVGIVGGSDLAKQAEQLGPKILEEFDFVFSENGLMAYKNATLFSQESIKSYLGYDRLKEFVNFCLEYIAKIDIPVKTGTFIELRDGLLNISPVGRNCSQQERDEYEVYDKANGIRADFVKALEAKFPDYKLTYSIGGQISFDVFPTGWDKTYCLQFLEKEGFEEIHFFGDKTFKGGNDFEIFHHPKTVGHTVTSWEDTKKQVSEILAADN